MKYLILFVSLIANFSFFGAYAEAARPCKVIAEACLSAGVIQRGVSRQTIFENCLNPILSGKSLQGVQVDSSVIEACRAKINAQR